ncbi:MAG: LysR family transcriptional regulator [Burkholderiaceae bacterium]|nr:LysR family transcriptional regulator [Burkholderiaceae bacterium]
MSQISSPNVPGVNAMDLTQLRTFVAVVQEGHLTRAAERLHISQPTASNHIKALESHFGIQLFVRTTRGLEPTAAGMRLAESASRVLGSTMELVSLARELQASPSGRLALGTIADPQTNRLPALVTWLCEHHPLLDLNIETRSSLSTKLGLRSGELDAGFFVSSALEDDMDGVVLKILDYVVAGPSAWKDRLPGADWRALAAMPWIVTPKGTSNADLCEHFFRPRGLQLNVALEVNNDALLRSLIVEGVGIGFVRRDIAEEGQARGAYSIAPMTMSSTKLLFGYLRARKSDPVIQIVEGGLQDMWFHERDTSPPRSPVQTG